jgi:very-short-patch-repair endonuclease
VPEFSITDADRPPELYGALLMAGEGLSAPQLNRFRAELEERGFHPLAKETTDSFLRRIAQSWPRGTFEQAYSPGAAGQDPVLLRDPVLFLRRRISGFPAAFDNVLQALDAGTEIPVSLARLAGVEKAPALEGPEAPMSPWGEPPDVLLSKPANLEQVQIARALERHHAVLVQGPPGTGKSHTIANLIGHLMAHGKRVLVTSHTTKALRVLRDQVVESLQPLCVAVLDQDLESRMQMEQSVRGILARLTQSHAEELRREADALSATRTHLNSEIDSISRQLQETRSAEYEPIVLSGESVEPGEAARWTRQSEAAHNWIPAPVERAAPLPLSAEEIRTLYETNARISSEEERQIDDQLPDPASLPDARDFACLVGAARGSEPVGNAAFWDAAAGEEDLPALTKLVDALKEVASQLSGFAPWQRVLVAAGHSGPAERALWEALARQVNECHERWQRSRAALVDHPVTCSVALPADRLRQEVDRILAHVIGGGRLGWAQFLLHGDWKPIVEGTRVGRSQPVTVEHFRALAAFLHLREGRERLTERWHGLAEPAGLPKLKTMGPDPEPTLKDLAAQFPKLCAWWPTQWPRLQDLAKAAKFRWTAFRDWHVARAAPQTPFETDAGLLWGPLLEVVQARRAAADAWRATRDLRELLARLARHRGALAEQLRHAVREEDVDSYAEAIEELVRVAGKLGVWRQRHDLLKRLGTAAPSWADAIRSRVGVHGERTLPGDVASAWRWRQLRQEIDRRATLDERVLTERLHQRQRELRAVTADLIDRRSWLAQAQRTGLAARQALQGWADTTKKIGRGTGKRVPELQARARVLLVQARDAVPVWIMPLSRVAESFDPTQVRFDVVIVDEASQSDVTGLLAWFLGDRIAIVGDHEQVSPMAVGQEVGASTALIAEHLAGIPNSHLYDGTTSIYDLARQSFGGTIALREHFRCVPDIIEFSNALSYNFEIRPLRNPSTAPRPHVIEYLVQPELGARRDGKTNLAEARAIVALLKALTELPEFADKTFGAISLLGDEQAGLIQDLAVSVLDAVELGQRRFVAGNAAQFQGDERDVMFLSMVDAPTGARLPLSQRDATKQRFNVAASRARDQMWVVHALDPGRDLQPPDLRRRLIEYVRDPGARRRDLQKAQGRAESPLEKAILARLIGAGYAVEPQVWVGRYRIDIVVRGGGKEMAVECDGDRYHAAGQIPADMVRQAVLERAGWRFVRVRGTRFYWDPDGTTTWLCEELARNGIVPVSVDNGPLATDHTGDVFREQIVRRAWEVMRTRGWIPTEAPRAEDGPGQSRGPVATIQPSSDPNGPPR